jgi:hypothetical protein
VSCLSSWRPRTAPSSPPAIVAIGRPIAAVAKSAPPWPPVFQHIHLRRCDYVESARDSSEFDAPFWISGIVAVRTANGTSATAIVRRMALLLRSTTYSPRFGRRGRGPSAWRDQGLVCDDRWQRQMQPCLFRTALGEQPGLFAQVLCATFRQLRQAGTRGANEVRRLGSASGSGN